MASITRGAFIHNIKIPTSSSPPSKKLILSFSIPESSTPRPPRVTPTSLHLKSAAGTVILTAATTAALLAGKFSTPFPATASPPPPATEERTTTDDTETEPKPSPSALSQFLDSNADAVDSLRSLLYEKLESGSDPEALHILHRLIAAQPAETEWKLLAARLLNEMGRVAESRQMFEEILAADPLCFEALFENAVLMDRCGEGEAVIRRLEEAAREEKKGKEERDVRLLIAQMLFLQKKTEEALRLYEELAAEDAAGITDPGSARV